MTGATLGYFWFRRFTMWDKVTCYFAAMPGGLNDMTIMGGAMGGQERAIALAVQEPPVLGQAGVVGEARPDGIQLLSQRPLREADVQGVQERVDEDGEQQCGSRPDEDERGPQATARCGLTARDGCECNCLSDGCHWTRSSRPS